MVVADSGNPHTRDDRMRIVPPALLALFLAAAALAQTAATPPVAKPADVATPDAIIDAVYASISGPAGQPRDWSRFRSLMIPGARLIPSARRTPGATTPVVWSAEEYIAAAGPGLERPGLRTRVASNDRRIRRRAARLQYLRFEAHAGRPAIRARHQQLSAL